MDCIILRYAEIGLKSKRTKGFFEKKYLQAIKEALNRKKIEFSEIKNYGGRFVVLTPNEDAVYVLRNVPGIESLSPAISGKFQDQEDLITKIKPLAEPLVKGKTFGVRVKKIGNHPFTSLEISAKIADLIYGGSAGVNLTSPEVAIYIELRDKDFFVYTQTLKGIGGLSSASTGKVLVLFSGGIDSPVAAHSMLKRGCKCDFLLVNFSGDKNFSQVAKVYNFLINEYAFNYTPKFYLINGQEIIEQIQQNVPDRLKQIALKINLYRLASEIAQEEGQEAIVTGEALSQKSSQTVQSLAVISSQTTQLMLRPLLGMNKTEIVELARKIGTLAASEKVKEYCNLSSGPVNTSPKMSDIEKIPVQPELIRRAVKEKKYFNGLIKIELEPDLIPEELACQITGKKPKPEIEFTTVDIRPKNLQELSPLKMDISKPYPFILEEIDEFDKNKTYLIICDYGVRSEEVAYQLRKKGVKAAGITLNSYFKYSGKKN
ncbi:MAG TPA: THUMP domain-containing protein [Candidatus Nanoarchaeia archaeon]|nr:THUMP domain-containing protein [Candidatus Nanoarchaeia archaeon]